MNRIKHFFRVFGKQSKWISVVNLDLGSFSTKIAVDDLPPKIIDSCYLEHRQSGGVVSFGKGSLDYFERQSDQIKVVFPFAQSRIKNQIESSKFLRSIFDKYLSHSKRILWQPVLSRVKIAVSPSYSIQQRKILSKIFSQLGAVDVQMIDKARAIFLSQFSENEKTSPILIVDIGADSTLIAVVGQGQPIKQKQIELGSQHFNKAIQRVAKTSYGCEIGFRTAERIKLEIMRIPTPGEEGFLDLQMAVRGKDVLSSLPKTITVSSSDFFTELEELVDEMQTQVLELLAELSFDDLQSVIESGVFLTGGGSGLRGIADFLENTIKINVRQSSQPYFDVITGLNYVGY